MSEAVDDVTFLADQSRDFKPSCCDWDLDPSAGLGGGYAPSSVVNNIMRSYGHRDGWIWDAPSLLNVLRVAGIPSGAVRVDGYRDPRLPAVLLDKDMPDRMRESLYLTATKPG